MKRARAAAEEAILRRASSLARRRRLEAKALKPSFVGAGASGGQYRLSERAEELLFEKNCGA